MVSISAQLSAQSILGLGSIASDENHCLPHRVHVSSEHLRCHARRSSDSLELSLGAEAQSRGIRHAGEPRRRR